MGAVETVRRSSAGDTGCRHNVGDARGRPGLTCLISDIISTVGPQGEHPDTLRSAYTNCLNKMKEAGLKSIVSLSHRSLSIFCLSETIVIHSHHISTNAY